jgi:hypothetical protein
VRIFHSNRECPTHRVELVLETIVLSPMGRALTNIQRVQFLRCPAMAPENCGTGHKGYSPDGRCMFMRPFKWQKYPLTPRRGSKTIEP